MSKFSYQCQLMSFVTTYTRNCKLCTITLVPLMSPYILMCYYTTELGNWFGNYEDIIFIFHVGGWWYQISQIPKERYALVVSHVPWGPITTGRKYLDNVIAINLAMFEIIHHRCLWVPEIWDSGCFIWNAGIFTLAICKPMKEQKTEGLFLYF